MDLPSHLKGFLYVGTYLGGIFLNLLLLKNRKKLDDRVWSGIGILSLIMITCKLIPGNDPLWAFFMSPFGFYIMKTLDLMANGCEFEAYFELSSPLKFFLFFLIPPTLSFSPAKSPLGRKPALIRAGQVFLTVVLLIFLSHLIDTFQIPLLVPWIIYDWIRGHFVLLTAFLAVSVALDIPAILVFGNMCHLTPCVEWQLLSRSARDFWTRHSKNAGLHLRRIFYLNLGGRKNLVAATATTFVFNGLLHATWHQWMLIGRFDWTYLGIFVVSAVVVGFELSVLVHAEKVYRSQWFQIFQFFLLQLMFAILGPLFVTISNQPIEKVALQFVGKE